MLGAAFVVMAGPPEGSDDPVEVQFDYRYTFGSKFGIHPPKILNKRAAIGALGKPEHPYGLGYPEFVTTDTRRRVWITDSGTGSVHIFDLETGAYREIRRLGDEMLEQPTGIARDNAGRIYLADGGTGGMYVFDENGEFDRALFRRGEHPLERPSAVALSADGRTIYVIDAPRNAIVALNREGEVNSVFELPEQRSGPAALSVVNNQLYILTAQRHKIYELNPAGRSRGELRFDGIDVPMSFVFDHGRRRFLASNPRSATVQVFNEDGQNLGAFGQYGDGVDQMRHVDSLYVDPRGLIYVVDSHDGKVLVFAESH